MSKLILSSLRRAAAALFCLAAYASPALASSSFDVETISDLYHITADRTLYHSREKVKEAFGHVVVSAEGQRLACDYLWIDDVSKEIKARGNVVFVDKGSTIEAAELHFNMNTGFGSIFYGRVYNDLYSLRGQLIRKVGDYHFLTTEGEYTTCKDCPESWKLAARNVDMTVDGYAFMDGVFVTIKDVPTLYIPYLVVPVKTRRQTGLLFPRLGAASNHGFVFVQPLFLAIDQHQDATLAFGSYSARGLRYEGEHRYMSYNGIHGDTNIYYTRDRNDKYESNRAAIKTSHEWPFAKHFGMRWRFFDVRDRDYTYDFAEDINVKNLPAIESNAVAQVPFNDFFMSVEARRYRNLLYSSPKGFDGGTVQASPTVHAGVKERNLVGPLMGSFYGRYDNFSRANGSFTDLNNNRLFDPTFNTQANPERLRETRRYLLSPELSVPYNIGSIFTVVPSAQYNVMHYDFNLSPPNFPLPSTSTKYFRYRVDFNTTIQRVYNYEGETVSKVSHLLTPFMNFSYIPSVKANTEHPFQRQLITSDGLFDQYDIVPFTNSTNFLRFPQGKSIYYGFDSRLVRKMRKAEELPRAYPYDLVPAVRQRKYVVPKNRKQELALENERIWDEFNPRYDLYDEMWTVNASQAYDFIDAENHREDPQRAFSYFLGRSYFRLDQFSHSLDIRYYPRLVTHVEKSTQELVLRHKKQLSTAITWTWKSLQNLRQTRRFQRNISLQFTDNTEPSQSRSLGLNLTWSFNDFAVLQLNQSFDFLAHRNKTWGANLLFAHPSECWGMLFRYDWERTREPQKGQFGYQLLLNLTGGGLVDAKSAGPGGGVGAFGGI